jgi:uncharacterized membrane protein YfcA
VLLSQFHTIHHPLFLFCAAFAAGVVNSVAGGGGFIAFPALLFVGIAPIAANATNTAALWPGTVASTFAYRGAFTRDTRRLLPPLIATGITGGVLGALVLLRTPQATFMRLVPWLLLGATLLFVFGGRLTAFVRGRAGHGADSPAGDSLASPAKQEKGSTPLLFTSGLFLQFLIAVYVGYFGAGAGILLLAMIALLGVENIHAMNGMKTLLVSVVNGVALVTFIWARAIVWPPAVLMLVAAASGGYGGALMAQKMNPQHVRWAIIATGFAMSIYFFIK